MAVPTKIIRNLYPNGPQRSDATGQYIRVTPQPNLGYPIIGQHLGWKMEQAHFRLPASQNLTGPYRGQNFAFLGYNTIVYDADDLQEASNRGLVPLYRPSGDWTSSCIRTESLAGLDFFDSGGPPRSWPASEAVIDELARALFPATIFCWIQIPRGILYNIWRRIFIQGASWTARSTWSPLSGFALNVTTNLIRIGFPRIGWKMFDEPEIGAAGNVCWATPRFLNAARQILKGNLSLNKDTGIGAEDVDNRFPVMINFSSRIVNPYVNKTRFKNWQSTGALLEVFGLQDFEADLYTMDYYPIPDPTAPPEPGKPLNVYDAFHPNFWEWSELCVRFLNNVPDGKSWLFVGQAFGDDSTHRRSVSPFEQISDDLSKEPATPGFQTYLEPTFDQVALQGCSNLTKGSQGIIWWAWQYGRESLRGGDQSSKGIIPQVIPMLSQLSGILPYVTYAPGFNFSDNASDAEKANSMEYLHNPDTDASELTLPPIQCYFLEHPGTTLADRWVLMIGLNYRRTEAKITVNLPSTSTSPGWLPGQQGWVVTLAPRGIIGPTVLLFGPPFAFHIPSYMAKFNATAPFIAIFRRT